MTFSIHIFYEFIIIISAIILNCIIYYYPVLQWIPFSTPSVTFLYKKINVKSNSNEGNSQLLCIHIISIFRRKDSSNPKQPQFCLKVNFSLGV